MRIGDYVKNIKAPGHGVGEIISISSKYIKVYYPDLDDDRDYLTDNNPLKKINSISPKNSDATRTSEKNSTLRSIELQNRVARDEKNALSATKAAVEEIAILRPPEIIVDIAIGATKFQEGQVKDWENKDRSLRVVRENPFHAMMEVQSITIENEIEKTKKLLVYANEHTSYNLLGLGPDKINILPWTHLIVQLAMSGELKEENPIRANGYTLVSITPYARATFRRVIPSISGLYEPGGRVKRPERLKSRSGLKPVKLAMTRDQVQAFLSKMNGMMLVSGAPGSGKTTVAMQRVRFLYDQQNERLENLKGIIYSPELTRIFLANINLIDYSKSLLKNELHIPEDVVELVGSFVTRYLGEIWAYKHNAKLRRKKLFVYEERGRQAFWGLCGPKDLKDCWYIFELQIADRLKQANNTKWVVLSSSKQTKIAIKKFAELIIAQSVKLTRRIASSPLTSVFKMDKIYNAISKEYEDLRLLMKEENLVEKFDQEFQQWLFWIYDPFDALVSYFSDNLYQGGIRIKNGVGLKIREEDILSVIKDDWNNRTYGKEEEPWLAFLLRFSLPEETDSKKRFRGIPNSLAVAGATEEERWTHIMIDEAQDLCVAEAALLSSFVHPDGAFTVSADFHQVVSPVWGMDTPEAFKIGSTLRDKDTHKSYPFAKNMRQTKQIGLFLRAFYQNIFREPSPFIENDTFEGPKPLLMVGRSGSFANMIRQRLNVLKRNPDIRSIALIQVNEDEEALSQYRESLEEIGVSLTPIWQSYAHDGELVTTSVERIKGLEYDACFVVGMDDIGSSTLKHSKNRAYVALSRPAIQLTIFCEEIPRSVQRIDKNLMEIFYI